jgi:putative DNA methylase
MPRATLFVWPIQAMHLFVVDPFAGGGSIPLEAIRIGCETFAGDLNPVASLILKAKLDDITGNGA